MVFKVQEREILNDCIGGVICHGRDSNIATAHSDVDFQMLIINALAPVYLPSLLGVALAGAVSTKLDPSVSGSMRSD